MSIRNYDDVKKLCNKKCRHGFLVSFVLVKKKPNFMRVLEFWSFANAYNYILYEEIKNETYY